MALPIAWAYLELGLPDPDNSVTHALTLSGLFMLGGLLTLLLTVTIRLGSVYGPLRQAVAQCFDALTPYFASLQSGHRTSGPITPETEIRTTIIEARRIATNIRARQQSASPLHQRLVILTEIADRLFSLSAMHVEIPTQPDELKSALSLPATASAMIARSLRHHPDPDRLHALAGQLERASRAGAGHDLMAQRIGTAMAEALRRAIRLVLAEEPVSTLPPAERRAFRLSAVFAPLLAALDKRSIVARHALRFAVVASLAVIVFWFFPPPFGYWVPLTVTVVLKPYAGMTLNRTVQRIMGTVAGILIGALLTPLATTFATGAAVTAVCFFWMMAVIPFNYSLAVLFLSAGLVPFEHVMHPALHSDVALSRLIATGIGAMLAVIGGHLLWPDFERDTVPNLLQASLRSLVRYADLVLETAATQGSMEAAAPFRRQAGLDLGNLQATVQRALSEVGHDPNRLQRSIRCGILQQRMLNTLNAIANSRDEALRQPQDIAKLRASLGMVLDWCVRQARSRSPVPRPEGVPAAELPTAPPPVDDTLTFRDREIGRLGAQTTLLVAALTEPEQR
jgi:uncharacterized membrane protein YccC